VGVKKTWITIKEQRPSQEGTKRTKKIKNISPIGEEIIQDPLESYKLSSI
jgi:hypothetical protein